LSPALTEAEARLWAEKSERLLAKVRVIDEAVPVLVREAAAQPPGLRRDALMAQIDAALMWKQVIWKVYFKRIAAAADPEMADAAEGLAAAADVGFARLADDAGRWVAGRRWRHARRPRFSVLRWARRTRARQRARRASGRISSGLDPPSGEADPHHLTAERPPGRTRPLRGVRLKVEAGRLDERRRR
jgi:hypothetical protein